MEVMGLMLGEFVDEYTVRVIDVFAMPQSGKSAFIPSVDIALSFFLFSISLSHFLSLIGSPMFSRCDLCYI